MEFHTGFISWRRERDSNSCRGISPNTISSIEPSEFQSKTNEKTIHRYIIRCIVYKKNVPVVSIVSRQIGAGAPLKTSREPRASAAARCERFSGFRESAQPGAGAAVLSEVPASGPGTAGTGAIEP